MKSIDLNWFISRFLGVSLLILLLGNEQAGASLASMALSGIAIALQATQIRLKTVRS